MNASPLSQEGKYQIHEKNHQMNQNLYSRLIDAGASNTTVN